MFALMRSAELHAYTCFAPRHHRVGKPDHVDALPQQITCHGLRDLRVVKHDWNDWMDARFDVEAGGGHLFAKIPRVVVQALAQLVCPSEQFKSRDTGGNNRWRQ